MILLGIDTESTGLDVKEDRIIEVGAVIYDTFEMVPLDVYSQFIIPSIPLEDGWVSPTGIPKEWLYKYGVSLPEAFGKIQCMMANASPDAVVAHNGEAFDKPLIFNELARHKIMGHALETAHWLDSRHDIPFTEDVTSRRLRHLAADHGIMNPFEHRALFDVLTMLKILDKYAIEEVYEQSKQPWITIRALTDYDNRQKAKDLRYNWDGKIWTKKIKQKDLDNELKQAMTKGFKITVL
jgi:DNA polymerase III epsilon subunit-like protein